MNSKNEIIDCRDILEKEDKLNNNIIKIYIINFNFSILVQIMV